MREAIFSKYQQELSDIRVAFSKAGCVTSIALVLLGVGLDLAIYPEHVRSFFAARILVSVLTLAIYFLIRTHWGRQRVRLLTLVWLSLPQVMISWMIATTNGAESIYFVGLHLALYATGIIVPLSYKEGIGFGTFTCLAYTMACALNSRGLTPPSQFAGNAIFIAFSATICVVCSYFAELLRMKLFELRAEVAEKNAALQEINQSLAQVKGQLVQQEKMAALGTLSAGLLHEVNNPVNYSLMALNMALREPEVGSNAMLKEGISDAKEGMQRVQSIVTDLKTFAYQTPGADVSRVFLLEKAIQSARRLTSFELKGIEVTMNLPQDTHVLGNEPDVIGVLINLFGNAALALRKANRAAPRIEVNAHHEGGRLHLRVRDNGTGIKPTDISRVFEPFFTTRDVGQGLGLGLSVSYSIIQRHGGTLAVSSEDGAWTEFSFDLALATPEHQHV